MRVATAACLVLAGLSFVQKDARLVPLEGEPFRAEVLSVDKEGVLRYRAGGEEKLDPRVDRARLREAAAEYKTALRLDPHYSLARVNYGAVLLDLGKLADAKKVLETATKRTPKLAGAWNNPCFSNAQRITLLYAPP